MSAEAPVLGDVHVSRRVGATVVHDGRRWAVWSVIERLVADDFSEDPHDVVVRRGVVLWSDEHGEPELVQVPDREARALPLVAVARIFRDGVRACVKRDHPEADPASTLCPSCGLEIGALR